MTNRPISITQDIIDMGRQYGWSGAEVIQYAVAKAYPEATDIIVDNESISFTINGEVIKDTI